MGTITEALTFDDVLMLPRYSNVLPKDTNITLSLTKEITLKVPFLSSAMDTVTESKMAIAMAKAGGIGIIHRNLKIKNQSEEIAKVKNKKLLVGAAIGTGVDDLDRAKSLLDSGVDLIVIDTAHGHSSKVIKILSNLNNVHLIEPMEYLAFIKIMDLSYLILTDSGGIQEEAPSLGKPVLVMRDASERPEAIEAGTVKLVGTNKDKIVKIVSQLLTDRDLYMKMSRAHNPYGDGKASDIICNILVKRGSIWLYLLLVWDI